MERITDVLSREHRVVLQALDRLDAALAPFSAEGVGKVLEFFDGGLALHRKKEESVLFREMANYLPANLGPVRCMLEEHEEERWHVEMLRTALAADEREQVIEHGRSVIALLRNHVWKEEEILFPIIRKAIPPSVHDRILEGFEAVAAGAAT